MTTVNYEIISPAEALFLFGIMEKSNSFASMSFHLTDPKKPQPYDFSESFFSTPYEEVKSEVVGNAIVVYMGSLEFGFDISEVEFSKHISEYRIEVWASTDFYTAAFESGDIEDKYLDEARTYKFAGDGPYPENSNSLMDVNEHEAKLIRFIRTLDFGVLLHITTATVEKARELKKTGIVLGSQYGDGRDRGFREYADKIKIFNELLGHANADYHDHIYPEEAAHE